MAREEKWLTGLFIVFSLVFVVLSFNYQPSARIFPLLMGGMTLVLLLVDVFIKVRKKQNENQETNSDTVDGEEHNVPKYFDLQIMRIILWLTALIILLYFINYLYAITVIVFFLLWIEAKESWKLSLSITLGLFISLYILFIFVLGSSF